MKHQRWVQYMADREPPVDNEPPAQPSFTIENEGYQLIWRECEDGEGGTIYWFERVPE